MMQPCQGARNPLSPVTWGDRRGIAVGHDAALGVPAVSLGVDSFGQSSTVSDLYRAHDLDAGSIVNAALAALSLR